MKKFADDKVLLGSVQENCPVMGGRSIKKYLRIIMGEGFFSVVMDA